MAKYHGATPTTAEIIEVHLLNFKPIFYPLRKKCKEDPRPGGGGALVRLGHSLVRVKI